MLNIHCILGKLSSVEIILVKINEWTYWGFYTEGIQGCVDIVITAEYPCSVKM